MTKGSGYKFVNLVTDPLQRTAYISLFACELFKDKPWLVLRYNVVQSILINTRFGSVTLHRILIFELHTFEGQILEMSLYALYMRSFVLPTRRTTHLYDLRVSRDRCPGNCQT